MLLSMSRSEVPRAFREEEDKEMKGECVVQTDNIVPNSLTRSSGQPGGLLSTDYGSVLEYLST